MRLTARQLNRATLVRQMLLRREAVDVAEAVRRVVALQAQVAGTCSDHRPPPRCVLDT